MRGAHEMIGSARTEQALMTAHKVKAKVEHRYHEALADLQGRDAARIGETV